MKAPKTKIIILLAVSLLLIVGVSAVQAQSVSNGDRQLWQGWLTERGPARVGNHNFDPGPQRRMMAPGCTGSQQGTQRQRRNHIGPQGSQRNCGSQGNQGPTRNRSQRFSPSQCGPRSGGAGMQSCPMMQQGQHRGPQRGMMGRGCVGPQQDTQHQRRNHVGPQCVQGSQRNCGPQGNYAPARNHNQRFSPSQCGPRSGGAGMQGCPMMQQGNHRGSQRGMMNPGCGGRQQGMQRSRCRQMSSQQGGFQRHYRTQNFGRGNVAPGACAGPYCEPAAPRPHHQRRQQNDSSWFPW